MIKSLCRCAVFCVAAFLTNSVANTQVVKPPAPKQAMTILVMPDPVFSQEIKGEASLPSNAKLDFGLDLKNVIRRGNWNVEGSITRAGDGKITFKTMEGDKGNLVFRLPIGMKMPLKSRMPIKIQRETKGLGATLGYSLILESQDQQMVLSGRLYNYEPLKVPFKGQIRLVQDDSRSRILSDTKFEKIYEIPVTLIARDREIELPLYESTTVNVNRQQYQIQIMESTRSIPSKESEGLEESSGYYLEYIMVLID